MLHFDVYFSRYRNGELRQSIRQDLSGADFMEAAEKARLMVRAMAGADPDSRFAIETITSGNQTRVIRCDGARLFDTAEELSARVAAERAA